MLGPICRKSTARKVIKYHEMSKWCLNSKFKVGKERERERERESRERGERERERERDRERDRESGDERDLFSY